mmetsp:Transcript_2661/g.6735  ORF Transcript_2661/g.6735 Transcript_2661/m.6735 type:complete len:901 (+) Transcript_2661:246-2948(+)
MPTGGKIYWRKPIAPPSLDAIRTAVCQEPQQAQQALAAHVASITQQFHPNPQFQEPQYASQAEQPYSIEQAEAAAKDHQNRRFTGVIKRFEPKKSFGFINCAETREIYGRDVFLLRNIDMPKLDVGDTVTFEVWLNEKKMPQARTVRKVNEFGKPDPSPSAPVVQSAPSAPSTIESRFDGNPFRLDIGLMTQDELHGAFKAFSASLKQHLGRLVKFDDSKGFGFIDCPELFAVYGRQVFAHTQQVREANAQVGDMVTFSVELNDKGFPQARKMKVRRGEDLSTFQQAIAAQVPQVDEAALAEQQAEQMMQMQEQLYASMAEYDQLDENFNIDEEPAEEPQQAEEKEEEVMNWQERVEEFVRQRRMQEEEEQMRLERQRAEEEELQQRLLEERALKERLEREERERQERERERFLFLQQQDEELQEKRRAEQEEQRQLLFEQVQQEKRAIKERVESTAVQHFKDRLDSALKAVEDKVLVTLPGEDDTDAPASSWDRPRPAERAPALTVQDAFGLEDDDDDANAALNMPKRSDRGVEDGQRYGRSRSRMRSATPPKGPGRREPSEPTRRPSVARETVRERPNRWDPEELPEVDRRDDRRDEKRDGRKEERKRRKAKPDHHSPGREAARRRSPSDSRKERRRRKHSRSRRDRGISKSRSAFRRRRTRSRSRSFRRKPNNPDGPKQLTASNQVPAGGYRYKEILIPQQFVARLIGKGGAVLQRIHQTSGTTIKIRQETQAFGYSRAIVTGGAPNVEHAEQLIQQTLGISGEPGFMKKEIDVAAEHVSALIGPAGSIIQGMRAQASGLQIEIRGPEAAGSGPHKAILGPGRPDQISIAEQLILQKVAEYEMDLALKLQASVDSNMHMIPCKFHAVGRCTKGAMCPFAHPPRENGEPNPDYSTVGY